jgi:hypothetical protein
MAKAKVKASQQGASAAPKAQPVEQLGSKTEAVRRALATLGTNAVPTEIQVYVKTHFGIEMNTKVISVYKSQLTHQKGKKRRPGRKPKTVEGQTEASPQAAPQTDVHFKDLRALREMTNRLGPSRMRELLTLMAD